MPTIIDIFILDRSDMTRPSARAMRANRRNNLRDQADDTSCGKHLLQPRKKRRLENLHITDLHIEPLCPVWVPYAVLFIVVSFQFACLLI